MSQNYIKRFSKFNFKSSLSQSQCSIPHFNNLNTFKDPRFHRSSSAGLLLNTPTTATNSRVQSAQQYWNNGQQNGGTIGGGRKEMGTDTPEFDGNEKEGKIG